MPRLRHDQRYFAKCISGTEFAYVNLLAVERVRADANSSGYHRKKTISNIALMEQHCISGIRTNYRQRRDTVDGRVWQLCQEFVSEQYVLCSHRRHFQ